MTQQQNIDELISGLADDLKPTKPLAHPLIRAVPFLAVAIGYIAVLVYGDGLRPDLTTKFADPSFMMEIFLMGFVAISSAIASCFLSVPDMRGQKWVIATPLTALGIFSVWSVIRSFSEGVHLPNLHFDHCMGEGMFMALIPLTILIFVVRKGATTRPYMSTLMNVLTAAGLGYVGLRFSCTMDTVGHATISHIIPYVAIGTVLGLGARKIFKW